MPRPLRVFLCHASQDKPAVWKLHRYLTQHGVKPWLDQADLLPGEDWEVEIPNAIFSSDVILVCLSKNSVNKEGMVQKEISFALDKALEKPGKIFIIPVKLEECDIPKRLSRYQWVDYSRPDGRRRLLMGLNKRVTELGGEVMPVIMEDSRQRTPRPQSPKPEIKKPQEQIASFPVLEDIKEESKKEIPAKPFTKLLDPSTLSPHKVLSTKADKQYEKKRLLYRLGGFALIAVFVLGLYSLFPLPSGQDRATLTSTYLEYTETPKPLAKASATFSSTSQPIKTPSPTPTLGIGSTMVSEKDGMVLVYVPAGEFTMGSDNRNSDEKPVHTVYLDAFWIDKTEVTNAMYAKCVDANQCNPPKKTNSYTRLHYFGNPEFDNYPVVSITWNMANDYCSWAERRLPTEAEWEKAARGPDARIYPWSNVMPKDSLLNYNSNLGDTTEVGKYPDGASIYGALDMAGNVWEWVWDWYDEEYYGSSLSTNPLGPDSGQLRVVRGGSWDVIADLVPATNRGTNDPVVAYHSIGFRCASSP